MTPRPAPAWRVAIEAHDLHGRWTIAEQVVEVRAVDDVHARIAASRQVHVAAGCPPWRPLLRRTYLRSRVVERVRERGLEAGCPRGTSAASAGVAARLRGTA